MTVNTKLVIEAALFASQDPLPIEKIQLLFAEQDGPSKEDLLALLAELKTDYAERGVELIQVASGYRFQSRAEYAEFIQRLWQRKPPRYSRALFETLALVAYKQPITRGEIEEVRGVAVSSHIVKTLMDRGWVRAVGHRDVPGKPALLATTKSFLDYFNLSKLTDLPPLSELMNFDELEKQLGFELPKGVDFDVNDEQAEAAAQAPVTSESAGEPAADIADDASAGVDEVSQESSSGHLAASTNVNEGGQELAAVSENSSESQKIDAHKSVTGAEDVAVSSPADVEESVLELEEMA